MCASPGGTHTRACTHTRRRKLSARATPRNSLVCPLVARWPRSIRMSIRITATERARNNFCSWDWSHCGWIVDPFSWPCCTSAPALPPFQSSSLQEKTTQLSSFVVLRPFRSIQRPRFQSILFIPFRLELVHHAHSDRLLFVKLRRDTFHHFFFFFELDSTNFRSGCWIWRNEWKINVMMNWYKLTKLEIYTVKEDIDNDGRLCGWKRGLLGDERI